MATPVHDLIQDQNLNILRNGATPLGKTDVAKADRKGTLARRKALNDISNSRKPSVLPSGKKGNANRVTAIGKDPSIVTAKSSKGPEKGKVSGRKALSDLTNSVKPPSKSVPNIGRKANAVTEENVASSFVEEGFLHNHRECIKAQTKAVEMGYFLKLVGLNNDVPVQQELSAKGAFELSSNKPENNSKHFKIEEMPEHLLGDQVFPESKKVDYPSCRSPKSPKSPDMTWESKDFSDLLLVETPKLL